MSDKKATQTSRFLSLVLRHEPGKIGIALDANGWVGVDELLAAMGRHGRGLTRRELDEIVATNDKKRFAFSDDGTRIRASQGHSVDVDLGLVPQAPPEVLFHGTVERFLGAIRADGLRKGERHHVHLSRDRATAEKVGERRGDAVILTVRAGEMHRAGMAFYVSANGVWLTDSVPPEYLDVPDVGA